MLETLIKFSPAALQSMAIMWYRRGIKLIRGSSKNWDKLGFPFAKFLRKKWKIVAFVHPTFARIISLCTIIGKLHFTQNCAIRLLRYSFLPSFAEHSFIKRLITGVNCIYKLGELITCLKLYFANQDVQWRATL